MKMRILGVSYTCGPGRIQSDRYVIVNRGLTTQLFEYASQPNLACGLVTLRFYYENTGILY